MNWNGIKVEPYWNVNGSKIIVTNNGKIIKVEPYWNVNSHTPFILLSLSL